MKPFSAIILAPDNRAEALCTRLAHSALISTVIVIQPNTDSNCASQVQLIESDYPPGGREITSALERAGNSELILIITEPKLELEEAELQMLVKRAAEHPDAAMLYSDFFIGTRQHIRPLIPYQDGSIRDGFLFGPLQLFQREKIMQALSDYGPLKPGSYAGLYELRLKLSCLGHVCHVPEPVGLVPDDEHEEKGHFAYVDPANCKRQHAMETIATEHLERIGALCRMPPRSFEARVNGWPVEASIIIPVRDRCRTIAEAMQSAHDQQTCFPFNVLVVDN